MSYEKLFNNCQGRFCDKGRKCENNPNLPLGSLEVFILWRMKPKIHNVQITKANGALTRENQNKNNKSAEQT